MKAWSLVPFAVLVLAGCSRGQPAAPTASAPACPATDFAGFAEAFMADEAVQHRYLVMPLQSLTATEGVEPGEPLAVEHRLTAETLPRVLMPSRADQAKQGLTLEIHEPQSPEPWISLSKPDASVQMIYRFEKTDCWRLKVMNDKVVYPR